ncbi:MAG: SCO family protein [Spirosomataceae bacterium]
MRYLVSLLAGLVLLVACETKPKRLPILGNREAVTKMVDGKEVIDTVYQTIPDFKFWNQDSAEISLHTYDGKIYIADFFFTTCPTICPKMKTQMLRVYQHFKGNSEVGFLSHTIDPKHDSVQVLHEYAKQLGITGNQWNLVWGDKEKIYEIGQKSYMVTATEDSAQPGGIVHSGAFILVDKQKRIRGLYDGTEPESVDKLMKDMELLLTEYHPKQ